MEFSPDNKYFMCCQDNCINVWNLENNTLVITFNDPQYSINYCTINNNSIAISFNTNNYISIYDINNFELINKFSIHDAHAMKMKFNNSALIICTIDFCVISLDLVSNNFIKFQNNASIQCITNSPNYKYTAILNMNGDINVINNEENKIIFNMSNFNVTSIHISNDLKIIGAEYNALAVINI
jgi:WD40 repeat protein